MNATSRTQTQPDGSFAELGIVTHKGREFASGGASVDLDTGRLFAYWTEKPGLEHSRYFAITTWDGAPLCEAIVTGSWPINSYLSTRMFSFSCWFRGAWWHGRGSGAGMSLSAKRGKHAPRGY